MNPPTLFPSHLRLGLFALFVLCAMTYLGGLHGGFLFDDFQNIVNNTALLRPAGSADRWLAIALSSDSGIGILRRPLSMLSFGLNVDWFGMNPFAFKTVNLVIHLLNGGLLYALARRLVVPLLGRRHPDRVVRPEYLALLATGLWLLHPLNVSGVIYIVQRMNELAALFTLAGLLCYVEGRQRMLHDEPGLLLALAGLVGFSLLAVLSKENGALIVAYALVIETTCYRFGAPQPLQKQALKVFFGLTVALPIALFMIHLAFHPQWLLGPGGYASRDFTLYQRLLSEARILCDYLVWIFVPVPAWMGLFHDDIITSTGLFNPVTTALSIAFLLALVAMAWKLRRRCPGLAFAVAWFLIGHAMESTILPLELVFEHRNYLPMAGLLLGAVCALAPLVPMRWPARWIGAGCVVLLLIVAGLTTVRAISWGGNTLSLALTEAQHHPASARAQYEAGRAIIVDGAMKGTRPAAEQQALPYFARSAMLDHNLVYPVTNLILIEARTKAVPKSAIADLADRLRNTPNYTQASPFLDMLVTASEQPLSLTAENISSLVDAALANPHFIPSIRAMILNNYGAYRFNVLHDQQAAITLTLAAAAQDPQNPYFQINLTKLALALGQPDKALEHLALAERLNKAGAYDQEIGSLQLQLRQGAH
ncbi:hypothetical protein [Rhodanobacter umsongensis]